MKNLTVRIKNVALTSLIVLMCLLGQARVNYAQQSIVDEKLKEIALLIDVKKDLDGALLAVEEVLKIDPNNTLAYNYRGLVYYTQHKYEQALADYNRAIALNPSIDPYYTNRGLAFEYQSKPDYVAAENDFKTAIKLNPNNGTAYYNLGYCAGLNQKWSIAIDNYNQAIKLGISYAGVYNNRGVANYNLGNYPQAIADYRKGLSLDPAEPNAKSNLAAAIAQQKQTLDQIQIDRFVAAELPKDALPNESPETLQAFARVVKLINAGSYAAAQDILTEINKKKPNNPALYYYQGVNAYKNNDYQIAIGSEDVAIKLNPNVAEFYFMRGIATLYNPDYWNIGVGEQALKDFNKAIELKSSYGDAYRERGVVEHNFGIDVPGASDRGDWELAIKFNPNDSEAHYLDGLAWSNFTDEWRKAENQLTLAINLGTARSAIYEARAYANYKLKNRAQAIADYQKSVELNPNNALAKENLRRLSADAKEVEAERRYREIDPYKYKMREVYHRYVQAVGGNEFWSNKTPTDQQDFCVVLSHILNSGEEVLKILLELTAAVRTDQEKAGFYQDYQASYKNLQDFRMTKQDSIRKCGS